MKKNNTILCLIPVIIFVVGYILLLGSYPLLDPDETRYVNIARDMLKSHKIYF